MAAQKQVSHLKNPAPAPVELLLLGPLQIKIDGIVANLTARKARALLAYLALRRGEAVPRETLSGLLWGDRGEEQARASLRQTLSSLRKALGDGAIVTSTESVGLADGGVWADVEALRACAESADLEAMIQATSLFRGDLLEGLTMNEPAFDHWLTVERERARLLLCQLLSRLVDGLAAEHRIEEAIAHAARLLALDPLQECVHRTLMRLYLAQGRHDAALNQFELCRQELANHLGVAPEKETLDLASEIKARRRQGNEGTKKVPIRTEVAVPQRDKPTIAVLPFTNLSDDAEQEYFANGITEDIITELGRFRSLCVIASKSTFAYPTRTASLQECAAALGARYLVEGSVRRNDPWIRITAQLLDAGAGTQLWAERYDGDLENIFALQDKVTCKIVSTLVGHLEDAEQRRVPRDDSESVSAYDSWLRGKAWLYKGTKDDVLKARQYFRKAMDLDPGFTPAYIKLCESYGIEHKSNWTTARDEALEKAFELATKAVAQDRHDSRTHLYLAWAYFTAKGHLDLAQTQMEEALRLNPNDYYNYCLKGWLSTCSGDLEDAQACATEAFERSRIAADGCLYTALAADYLSGRYGEAISDYGRMSRPDPEMHAWAAATYAQQGQLDKAKSVLDDFYEAVRPFPTTPERDDAKGWQAYWAEMFPARDAAAREHLLDGLRKAGLAV
jgi:TolB-like protein